MDSPVTYIIVRSYFMADFILEAFKGRDDVVIVRHTPRRGVAAALLKPLRMALGNPRGLFNGSIFTDEFCAELPRIKATDRVILWGVENYKYVMMMARELPAARIVSFLWNPMKRLAPGSAAARRYASGMRRMGVEVCTFDRRDSEALGCRLVPQVHRKIDLDAVTPSRSVFFIGCEKGREELLADIITRLEADGIDSDIRIVRSRHHRFVGEQIERRLVDGFVGYSEVLDAIARSSCLIDIVQPGQTGVTLRTIEAMFYGKKLITNNTAVREHPFYHPSRVYLFGEEPQRTLREFIDTAAEPFDDRFAEPFCVERWIENIFNSDKK